MKKHAALVFIVACVVYLNSLGGAFVSDDRPLILDHPYTQHLRDFPAIFTAGHYAGKGGYRPLTTSSFALNYQLGGTNPWSYHLVNLLLHGLVSVLVYLLVLQIFQAQPAALIAALLFAVHPVHSEAVAWISGRAELLAALFSLGSWLVYLRGRFFAVALVLFFAGLLSKENALVLPLLVIAGDLYLSRRGEASRAVSARLKYYAGFAGVIAFYFVFRWALYHHTILRGTGGIAFIDNPAAQTSIGVRVMTALKILGEYFQLLLWPRHLTADYSFNAVPLVHNLGDPGFLFGCALVLVLLGILFASFFARDTIWLAIAFAFIAMAPTANFFVPIGTIKAERLLYLPSVGFCMAVGLICARLELRRPLRLAANAIMVVALLLLSVRTWVRNADWQTELTLWAATARTAPENFRAQSLLGSLYLKSSASAAAIAANQRALAINPSSEDALLNLGVALVQAGRISEAMELYERAIADHPERASFHLNLGLAYALRGDILSAAESFRDASKLDPASAVAHFNLGLALSRMGNKTEALENYRRATELKPDYAEAWNALGALSLKLGKKEEARAALKRALALRPDYDEARFNLDLLDSFQPYRADVFFVWRASASGILSEHLFAYETKSSRSPRCHDPRHLGLRCGCAWRSAAKRRL
ncbi:MAG: tetratricopeptide repeat protein [Verrucomicrobiota bacterium]|nr:tetratricopeptide repeat protein [Verrucomicrobiota bacterium]